MNNRVQHIILFLFLIITCSAVKAQEQVQAVLDSTAILIGDQIGLHLRVSSADNVRNPSVNLDPLRQVTELEIVGELNWDTLDIMGNRVLQKDIILTSFDSGYYFVPALIINYQKDGRNISKPTNRLAISVNTLPTDPATIAPIKDIIREPVSWKDLWPLYLFFLAIGAVVGIFYLNRKYNNKEKEEEIAPPPLPAHEIGLKKLADLKAQKLWQQGNVKEYQSRLTYIVREYLENRFEIQALEQTSDQILRSMKTNNIEESYRQNLQEMFTMADLVKFAKAEPPIDANDKLMDYAEQFVRRTKKVIVETEEQQEKTNS